VKKTSKKKEVGSAYIKRYIDIKFRREGAYVTGFGHEPVILVLHNKFYLLCCMDSDLYLCPSVDVSHALQVV